MIMKKFKELAKYGLNVMAALLPFELLRYVAGQKLIIVNYHSLQGWDNDPFIRQKKYRTEERFADDLQFFNTKYNVIKPVDFFEHRLNGKELPSNALLVTIDDGLKVVYDRMYPVLLDHGIQAAVFINPLFIDNNDMHYLRKRNLLLQLVNTNGLVDGQVVEGLLRAHGQGGKKPGQVLYSVTYGQKQLLDELAKVMNVDFKQYMAEYPVYLSFDEIKQMQTDGFAFGAHSMDHPPYTELSMKEQVDQTLESVDWLAKHLNTKYRIFAFPSNDAGISMALFQDIEKHVDLSFGVQGMRRDVVDSHFQRVEVEASGRSAKQALKYEYLRLLLYRVINKGVVKRAKSQPLALV